MNSSPLNTWLEINATSSLQQEASLSVNQSIENTWLTNYFGPDEKDHCISLRERESCRYGECINYVEPTPRSNSEVQYGLVIKSTENYLIIQSSECCFHVYAGKPTFIIVTFLTGLLLRYVHSRAHWFHKLVTSWHRAADGQAAFHCGPISSSAMQRKINVSFII